ncbi:hypothetical protein CFC21_101378 [Triticum aestivum]|uniref:F-box domain-containing protein n=2 Tax=Triticum aestivum TaxID=4565 RepID=A0A9R1M311_WHEAT|nr:hypothetical protein CFC21_101378 [Triticum aestivum]
MPPARVRELGEMYELVEEILLLIPPEEPAVLIHASLVCKAWCRLLSSHAFRSRYHTLHKTPPVLCFLQRWEDNVERFVPTTKFRPRNPERRDSYVLDCRHGRILLGCRWYDEGEEDDEEEEADEQLEEEEDDIEEDGEGEEADKEEEEYDTGEEGEEDDEDEDEGEEDDRVLKMVVWDPVSGGRTKLRSPDIFDPDVNGATYWGTVLCAADGCNHASCNLGPFFVALRTCTMVAYGYICPMIKSNLSFCHRTILFLFKHPPPGEDPASLSEPTLLRHIRSYMAYEASP